MPVDTKNQSENKFLPDTQNYFPKVIIDLLLHLDFSLDELLSVVNHQYHAQLMTILASVFDKSFHLISSYTKENNKVLVLTDVLPHQTLFDPFTAPLCIHYLRFILRTFTETLTCTFASDLVSLLGDQCHQKTISILIKTLILNYKKVYSNDDFASRFSFLSLDSGYPSFDVSLSKSLSNKSLFLLHFDLGEYYFVYGKELKTALAHFDEAENLWHECNNSNRSISSSSSSLSIFASRYTLDRIHGFKCACALTLDLDIDTVVPNTLTTNTNSSNNLMYDTIQPSDLLGMCIATDIKEQSELATYVLKALFTPTLNIQLYSVLAESALEASNFALCVKISVCHGLASLIKEKDVSLVDCISNFSSTYHRIQDYLNENDGTDILQYINEARDFCLRQISFTHIKSNLIGPVHSSILAFISHIYNVLSTQFSQAMNYMHKCSPYNHPQIDSIHTNIESNSDEINSEISNTYNEYSQNMIPNLSLYIENKNIQSNSNNDIDSSDFSLDFDQLMHINQSNNMSTSQSNDSMNNITDMKNNDSVSTSSSIEFHYHQILFQKQKTQSQEQKEEENNDNEQNQQILDFSQRIKFIQESINRFTSIFGGSSPDSKACINLLDQELGIWLEYVSLTPQLLFETVHASTDFTTLSQLTSIFMFFATSCMKQIFDIISESKIEIAKRSSNINGAVLNSNQVHNFGQNIDVKINNDVHLFDTTNKSNSEVFGRLKVKQFAQKIIVKYPSPCPIPNSLPIIPTAVYTNLIANFPKLDPHDYPWLTKHFYTAYKLPHTQSHIFKTQFFNNSINIKRMIHLIDGLLELLCLQYIDTSSQSICRQQTDTNLIKKYQHKQYQFITKQDLSSISEQKKESSITITSPECVINKETKNEYYSLLFCRMQVGMLRGNYKHVLQLGAEYFRAISDMYPGYLRESIQDKVKTLLTISLLYSGQYLESAIMSQVTI